MNNFIDLYLLLFTSRCFDNILIAVVVGLSLKLPGWHTLSNLIYQATFQHAFIHNVCIEWQLIYYVSYL